MQGARRRPWWLPRASRATPQTPLSLPTLRDRADFPSCGVVASSLGLDPTASAPPCLRGNLPRSRPREILRQAPRSRPIRVKLSAALCIVIMLLSHIEGAVGDSADPFVHPPALERDIRFWIRVYTEVTTDQGLLHDDWNLGLVYEVLCFDHRS